MKAGITRALPLELLHDLKTNLAPTVLFLDDLGQAPTDVQAAAMQLFDPGFLPETCLVWGATNRTTDRAGVQSWCTPLTTRFDCAFEIATPTTATETPSGAVQLQPWKAELDAWLDWAIANNAPPEVIAWHRATAGNTLYQFKPHADPSVRLPDFRTWGTAIRLWNSGFRDLPTFAATIGKPAAADFLAFAALAASLPTPDEVRIDPMGAAIPTTPNALYLIVSMLSAVSIVRDCKPWSIYAGRLDRVFGALLYRDMARKHHARWSGEPAAVKWTNTNQSLLT
jgi:hypothetical protein